MRRVRLVHWDVERAELTRRVLRKAGLEVDYDEQFNSALLRACRENPPAVFVIDLSRKPSHGREIAIALRQSPKTREIPIVFCDGDPGKVKVIRKVLPDATYCRSEQLGSAIKEVRPLPSPVKPPGMMDRYSMRTTAQKLGSRREQRFRLSIRRQTLIERSVHCPKAWSSSKSAERSRYVLCTR